MQSWRAATPARAPVPAGVESLAELALGTGSPQQRWCAGLLATESIGVRHTCDSHPHASGAASGGRATGRRPRRSKTTTPAQCLIGMKPRRSRVRRGITVPPPGAAHHHTRNPGLAAVHPQVLVPGGDLTGRSDSHPASPGTGLQRGRGTRAIRPSTQRTRVPPFALMPTGCWAVRASLGAPSPLAASAHRQPTRPVVC